MNLKPKHFFITNILYVSFLAIDVQAGSPLEEITNDPNLRTEVSKISAKPLKVGVIDTDFYQHGHGDLVCGILKSMVPSVEILPITIDTEDNVFVSELNRILKTLSSKNEEMATVNISLNIYPHFDKIFDSIRLLSKKAIIMIAAGNKNIELQDYWLESQNKMLSACLNELGGRVILVGATEKIYSYGTYFESPAAYSNWPCESLKEFFISVPGSNIIVTTGTPLDEKTEYYSGTSYAIPVFSASILTLSNKFGLTLDYAKKAIFDTSIKDNYSKRSDGLYVNTQYTGSRFMDFGAAWKSCCTTSSIINRAKQFYQKFLFRNVPLVSMPSLIIPDNITINQLEGFVLKELFQPQYMGYPMISKVHYNGLVQSLYKDCSSSIGSLREIFEIMYSPYSLDIAQDKLGVLNLLERLPLEAISVKLMESMPRLLGLFSNKYPPFMHYLITSKDLSMIDNFIKDVPTEKLCEHFGNLNEFYTDPNIRPLTEMDCNWLPSFNDNIYDLRGAIEQAQANAWDMFSFFSITRDIRYQYQQKNKSSLGMPRFTSDMFITTMMCIHFHDLFLPNRKKIEELMINYDYNLKQPMREYVLDALKQ